LSSKTMTRLNLDSLVVMYKRLRMAGRQQTVLARSTLLVNGQVIRMVRQCQLAQNENRCQESECDSPFTRYGVIKFNLCSRSSLWDVRENQHMADANST
jgi:hypothetical protein